MKLLTELGRWAKLRSFWKDRHTFYKTLGRSLEKKELLRDFIDGEYEIAMDTNTKDAAKAKGLQYMRNVMDKGVTSIADVLQAVMPATDRMALSILGGSKDQVAALFHLANAIENQNEMKKVVRNALITPLLLIPVGFAFAFTLTRTVIPAFVESAPDEVWTGFYSFYRGFAEGMATHGLWIFGLITALTIFMVAWGLPNITGDWRFRMEKLRGGKAMLATLVFPYKPIFTLYRDVEGTKMLTDLAFMLQSGRMISDGVETLTVSAQPWMRKHMRKILMHLRELPGQYVGAFSYGILSPYLAGYMRSLDRVDSEARFDRVLVEISERGAVDAREAIRRAAFRMNFGLLAAMITLIGFLYLGQMAVVMKIQESQQPAAVMKREAQRRQQAEQNRAQIQETRSVSQSPTTRP